MRTPPCCTSPSRPGDRQGGQYPSMRSNLVVNSMSIDGFAPLSLWPPARRRNGSHWRYHRPRSATGPDPEHPVHSGMPHWPPPSSGLSTTTPTAARIVTSTTNPTARIDATPASARAKHQSSFATIGLARSRREFDVENSGGGTAAALRTGRQRSAARSRASPSGPDPLTLGELAWIERPTASLRDVD